MYRVKNDTNYVMVHHGCDLYKRWDDGTWTVLWDDGNWHPITSKYTVKKLEEEYAKS